MCVLYVAGAMYVILQHATEVPYYMALIVKSAFTPVAESGACAGVSVWIAFQWGTSVGVFGMALKFMECSLAVMYRDVRNGDDSDSASPTTPICQRLRYQTQAATFLVPRSEPE